jgi:Na+/proline symporter/signal transduction histidine kinase
VFDPLVVIAGFIVYIGCLFLLAQWVEKKSATGRRIAESPLVYSLSLAVYCTTWTYYGSVGKAATSGMLFLAIYLGPTMAILLWRTVLVKLVRIKSIYHITSIADFISARYNKSQPIAALVTFIALIGITPYVALQLKAVISTLDIITAGSGSQTAWIETHVGPIVVGLMVVFTIMFGVRRLDPTERHEGMVMALAVECLVKLVVFLAAGIFVTYFMYDGFGDIFTRLSQSPFNGIMAMGGPGSSSYLTWMSYTILAMSAILFLPRQFHIAVVENSDEKHISSAMWMFPLYMFLINIFVFPVAAAGLLKGYPAQEADTFLLSLPLRHGGPWLAFLVFIGGFSAATGMMMVSSITMATMITNHLLLPILESVKRLGFLRRHLLRCRWAAVAAVILMGYWFELQVGESYMLVNIGMISFAAVLQFAPAILGGIFWQRGSSTGAFLGLGTGFLVWSYTLLFPSFVKSGWLSHSLLEHGPWGIELLKPEQLFGVVVLDPYTHAVFWTMLFNITLYVAGSLLMEGNEEEQRLAAEFVGILTPRASFGSPLAPETYIKSSAKLKEIRKLLGRYLSDMEAEAMADRCFKAAQLDGKSEISIIELAELHSQVEKTLAGSIGSASAHKVMSRGAIFTPREAKELSEVYADILGQLKVTPEELKKKVDYYQERASLLLKHAQELQAAQDELIKREKLSVLGRLTATVSHELRNPLAVIRSSAFFLYRKLGGSDEKTGKHLRRIEEQVQICDSIVSNLLEYTRGRRSEVVHGEIKPWIEKVLDEVTLPARVTLIRRLSPDLLPIRFDPEKMRGVLINLVDNAVQAALAREGDGSGREPHQPCVTVSTSYGADRVLIEVEDNGVGMDEETVRHAFEPLFTTRARGTGLGLAIVQKTVQEHGGTVELHSEENHMTRVTVEIPTELRAPGEHGNGDTETTRHGEATV